MWDRQNPEHIAFFLTNVLAPLIAVWRPKHLASERDALEAAGVWLVSLRDIPRDVLVEAVELALVAAPQFMPRPREVRQAAAGVIADRRARLNDQASRILAACTECDQTGFRTIYTDAYPFGACTPCDCRKRANQLHAARPAPLMLGAAPAAAGDEVDA